MVNREMYWKSRVLGSFWNFIQSSELSRSHHTSNIFNSNMYILGGFVKEDDQNEISNSFIKYNLSTGEYKSITNELSTLNSSIDPQNQWISIQKKQKQLPPLAHHTTTTVNKKLYVFGGMTEKNPGIQCTNHLYQFDILTHQWYQIKTKGEPPKPRFGHTTVYTNSKLYVFGGTDGDVQFKDVHIFDLASQTWFQPKTHGKSPGPRYGHSASVYGDFIFIFAGGSDKRIYNDLLSFNINTMTWKIVKIRSTFIPSQRLYHTANIIANYLIVIGGSGQKQSKKRYTEIMKFDLETLEWSEVKCPQDEHAPTNLEGHSTNIVGTRLWVLGGGGDTSESLLYTLETSIKGVNPIKLPPSSINRDFETLVNDKILSDIIFEFPSGLHFYGHMAFFRVRCPVLHRICIKHELISIEDLFNELMRRCKESLDFDPVSLSVETFGQLMTFIYADRLPEFFTDTEQKSIQDLYFISKLVKLDRLSFYCISHLSTNPGPSVPAPCLSHQLHRLYEVALAQYKILKASTDIQTDQNSCHDADERRDMSPLFEDEVEWTCSTEDMDDSQTMESDEKMSVSTNLSALTSLNHESPALHNHCDVLLHVENTSIPAHRCVLLARSEYFRLRLVTENPNEPFRKEITLSEMTEASCLKILEYLYCGSVSVHFDIALELLITSEKMDLERLSALCQQVIERKIRVHNAIDFLNIAKYYELTHLRESCMYFIVHHLATLRRTSAYQEKLDRETKFEIKRLRKDLKGQGLYDFTVEYILSKKRKRSTISNRKKNRSNKHQQSKKPKSKRQKLKRKQQLSQHPNYYE